MRTKLTLFLAGAMLLAGIAIANTDNGAEVETQVLDTTQSIEDAAAPQTAAADESDTATADEQPKASEAEVTPAQQEFIGTALQAVADDPQTIVLTDMPVRDGAIPPQAPEGFFTGHDIEDLQLTYNPVTDELTVLLRSFGIIGDVEGNGDPSTFAQEFIDAGLPGTDIADLGGGEHAVIAFDLDQDGFTDVVAGVSQARDISEFLISSINVLEVPGFGTIRFDSNPFDEGAFGETLTDNFGTIPTVAPNADNPDLEFSIANFSALVPGDGGLDFGVNAFLGSSVDGNIGEDTLVGAGSFVSVALDAEIGDEVFLDENADGINDPGEPGVPGVTVNLLDEAGTVVDTTTTDDDGNFLFTTPPGVFIVEFVPPAGFDITRPLQGQDPSVDSNATLLTGRSEPVVLNPGDSDLTIDAGLLQFIPAPGIDIEKATNGVDADTAPGVELIVGEVATFTFVATNTGNVDLADVSINDDVLGPICGIENLAVGASETCETTATVTEGQQQNVATATGQPIDPATGEPIGDPVTADDPSNHIGIVPGPPCVADIRGPRLFAGDRVIWDTGYVAQAGSTLIVETEEPGGSPGQPNEQVYVFVGDVNHGITPIDLGTIEIEAQNTGRVSFVHYSVITGDTSHPNSVEIEFCGTDIAIDQAPACETNIEGPRLHAGGQVEWQSGIIAEAGSTIRITTTEPGESPDQPNEQVWVRVGVQLFGPTPVGLGTLEFTAERGGEVEVLHFSRVTGFDGLPNSVEFEFCGTHLR